MIKHTLRCVDWLHCVADWISWSWAVYRQAACITRETEMKACFNTLSVSITHLGYMPLNFIQLLPDFPGIFAHIAHCCCCCLVSLNSHILYIFYEPFISVIQCTPFDMMAKKKIGNGTPSRSLWNIHRIHLIWETSENEWNTRYTNTQFSNAYHSFLLSFEPVLFIYINSFYCIKGPIMNDGCAKWEWWEKKAQRITTKHMHAISLSSSEHNAQEKRNGGKWRWIDFECILEFYLVAVKKAICKMHKEHDEVNRKTTSTNTHTVRTYHKTGNWSPFNSDALSPLFCTWIEGARERTESDGF